MCTGNDQMKIAFKKEEFGICTLGERKKKGTLCVLGEEVSWERRVSYNLKMCSRTLAALASWRTAEFPALPQN